jgi:hypothetical protein
LGLLRRDVVRSYGSRVARSFFKSASTLLAEQRAASKQYDVFLSHRYGDREELLGLLELLQKLEFSVFVDWKERPELDREDVTAETAAVLKEDMGRCKSLLFAVTSTAMASRWMPWELGLFDGLKGRVAIVPLATAIDKFPGAEYIGLYPYIDEITVGDRVQLFVNRKGGGYKLLKQWIAEGI